MNLEGHCYRSGCICTHTAPCEYGWIWVEYYDEIKIKKGDRLIVKSERREGVTPCPTCDPARASIFASAKDGRDFYERLSARSTYNRKQAYEEAENSKTRTL